MTVEMSSGVLVCLSETRRCRKIVYVKLGDFEALWGGVLRGQYTNIPFPKNEYN